MMTMVMIREAEAEAEDEDEDEDDDGRGGHLVYVLQLMMCCDVCGGLVWWL